MEQQHFLLVSIPVLGHINPARRLAHRLARIDGARVTVSTGLSAHRKLFPSSDKEEAEEGLVSYFAYSDDYEDDKTNGPTDYFSKLKLLGSKSLSLILSSLAARGRPVTCVVYTILLYWAADVAHAFDIPSVPLWVQPAAVLLIVYHYFHGASDLVCSHRDDPSFALELPGLPPLRSRDIPSFLYSHDHVFAAFEEMFQLLDRQAAAALAGRNDRPMVLVNTCEPWEPDAGSSIEKLELMSIGPMVDDRVLLNDLFEDDNADVYMEWLDSREEGSVVYVSFGSIAALTRRQLEEIHSGLEESGRPYLWVVRKDAIATDFRTRLRRGGGSGLVVEWCNQVRVLLHRAVGCFVTHCGWNSTAEGLACGVPMVMLPMWADQATNAKLVEGVWGAGVRVEVADGEGLAEGRELARCLGLVMGSDCGEIRSRALMWREKASEATKDGGSSNRNLKAFVQKIRGFSCEISCGCSSS